MSVKQQLEELNKKVAAELSELARDAMEKLVRIFNEESQPILQELRKDFHELLENGDEPEAQALAYRAGADVMSRSFQRLAREHPKKFMALAELVQAGSQEGEVAPKTIPQLPASSNWD